MRSFTHTLLQLQVISRYLQWFVDFSVCFLCFPMFSLQYEKWKIGPPGDAVGRRFASRRFDLPTGQRLGPGQQNRYGMV